MDPELTVSIPDVTLSCVTSARPPAKIEYVIRITCKRCHALRNYRDCQLFTPFSKCKIENVGVVKCLELHGNAIWTILCAKAYAFFRWKLLRKVTKNLPSRVDLLYKTLIRRFGHLTLLFSRGPQSARAERLFLLIKPFILQRCRWLSSLNLSLQ